MTPGRNGLFLSLTGWDITVLATLAVVLGIGLVPAHWRVKYNQQLLTPPPPAPAQPADSTPTLPPTPGPIPVDTPTLPPTPDPAPVDTAIPFSPTPPSPDTPAPTTPPTVAVLEADLQLGVAVTVQSKLITYTVMVTNHGPANLVTASVVNIFSLPPAVISAGGVGCSPHTGSPITCTVGNLQVDMPSTLILTATIHPDFSGFITNTVTVTDTGDIINTNPNNSVPVRTMIEASPTPPSTPSPEPQPCPVRLLGPENFFSFKSSDELDLTWSSGELGPDEHYRLSFRTVDESRELNALLTKNSFSRKRAGVDHWTDDNGDWLSDVVENGQYLWTVAVVQNGATIVCEASEKRVLTWILPPSP